MALGNERTRFLMNFYIADTHFYDRKCLTYDNRPFLGVSDMNDTIIRNWNSVVSDNDTVYVIGDFSYGMGADMISVAQRLRGHKILVRGNHDNDVNLKYAFEKIVDYHEEINSDGHIVLCHYPILSFKNMQKGGTVHIYGHVHNTYEAKITADTHRRLLSLGYKFEAYNVGCMQSYMNYTPRTLAELRTLTMQTPLDFSAKGEFAEQ